MQTANKNEIDRLHGWGNQTQEKNGVLLNSDIFWEECISSVELRLDIASVF